MHLFDQIIDLLLGHFNAEALRLEVVLHALFSAANLEQFVVILNIPLGIEPHMFEGVIESNTVTITFGVDNHAVLIKKYCFDSHVHLLSFPGTAENIDPTSDNGANGITNSDIDFPRVVFISFS